MFKTVFPPLLILFLSFSAWASMPEFSQFFAAPLHLNPALAGIGGGPRFHLNYRNQWPGMEKAFITYMVGYDQHIKKLSGGIGVHVMTDQVGGGLLNTYRAGLTYSYQLQLKSNLAIKAGLQAEIVNKQLNWNRLRFTDMLDPIYGLVDADNNVNSTLEPMPLNTSLLYPDFGAGIVLFTPKLYAGAGIRQMTRPQVSFTDRKDRDSRLPVRITYHAGYQVDINPKKGVSLVPNVLIAHQSSLFQINAGVLAQVQYILAGVWFKQTIQNPDALIGMLGFEMKNFRVAYSFDHTLSDFQVYPGGSHEISISLRFGDEKNSLGKSSNQTACPNFLKL